MKLMIKCNEGVQNCDSNFAAQFVYDGSKLHILFTRGNIISALII